MPTPEPGVPYTSGGVDDLTQQIIDENAQAADAAESDTEVAALDAEVDALDAEVATKADAAWTVLGTASIAADARFPHPLPEAVLVGTFVAPASGQVDIEVDLHGNNAGFAYANLSLVVGIPSAGLLRGTGRTRR